VARRPRRQRPGDIAREIIDDVPDSELSLVQEYSGRRILEARRNAQLREVERRHAGLDEGARRRMQVVDGWIANLQASRDERVRQRRPRVQAAAAWRELGIQQRVPVLDVSMPIRAVIMTALALLDFHIFAQAIAYAAGIKVSLTNTAYLLAGALGLMVFACGVLLGRAIKEWVYAAEQQRLLDEHRQRPGNEGADLGVVAGRPPRLLAYSSAALFVALIAISIGIRTVELKGVEELGIVALQALIPVLAMVIEVFLHDPSRVPERGTAPLLTLLQWRRSRYRAEVNQAMGRLNVERLAVQERYAVELAVLEREELSRGRLADGQDGNGSAPADVPPSGG